MSERDIKRVNKNYERMLERSRDYKDGVREGVSLKYSDEVIRLRARVAELEEACVLIQDRGDVRSNSIATKALKGEKQ